MTACARKKRCVIALAAVAMLSSTGLAAEEAGPAIESLDAYFQSCKVSKIRLLAELRIIQPNGDSVLGKREELEVALDLMRRKVKVYKTRLAIPGKDIASNVTEQLLLNGGYFAVGSTSENSLAETVTSRVNNTDEYWDVFISRSFYSILFGVLPLDGPDNEIVDQLRRMNAEIVPHNSGGVDEVKLASMSDEISIEVTLDKGRDFMPLRVVMKRKSPGPLGIINYDYKVTDSQTIADVSFPKKVSITWSRRHTDVEVEHRVREVEVIHADFREELPDDEFQVLTKIPNGTRVVMSDAPQLAYVWKDGEAVPDVGGNPILIEGDTDSQVFMPKTFDLKRRTLLLVTVAVVLVLAYLVIRNRIGMM